MRPRSNVRRRSAWARCVNAIDPLRSMTNHARAALRAACPDRPQNNASHMAHGSFMRWCAALALLAASQAHASLFHGDTLDAVADGIAWVALVIAPVIGITVFWLVHI